MGTNYYAVEKKFSLHRNIIHIGKSSAGWKFLFHGYQNYEYAWDKSPINLNSLEDWKKFLMNKEYGILDEYDEEISYEDFFKKVEEKQTEENEENFRDCANVNGYRFCYRNFS